MGQGSISIRTFRGIMNSHALATKALDRLNARLKGRRSAERMWGLGQESFPRLLPQTVWMFWDKGEANAPYFVKRCVQSWRDANPGWDVRVLDMSNIREYLEPAYLEKEISIQHLSDILRVRLLRQFGGVWVDATCWCNRPLGDWLPPLMISGFFAFGDNSADSDIAIQRIERVMATWMMASSKNGRIATMFDDAISAYWKDTRRADVYFWLNYLFKYLASRNDEFRALWRQTPRLSPRGPHLVKRLLTTQDYVAPPEADIDLSAIPVFKLSASDPATLARLEALLRTSDTLDVLALWQAALEDARRSA